MTEEEEIYLQETIQRAVNMLKNDVQNRKPQSTSLPPSRSSTTRVNERQDNDHHVPRTRFHDEYYSNNNHPKEQVQVEDVQEESEEEDAYEQPRDIPPSPIQTPYAFSHKLDQSTARAWSGSNGNYNGNRDGNYVRGTPINNHNINHSASRGQQKYPSRSPIPLRKQPQPQRPPHHTTPQKKEELPRSPITSNGIIHLKELVNVLEDLQSQIDHLQHDRRNMLDERNGLAHQVETLTSDYAQLQKKYVQERKEGDRLRQQLANEGLHREEEQAEWRRELEELRHSMEQPQQQQSQRQNSPRPYPRGKESNGSRSAPRSARRNGHESTLRFQEEYPPHYPDSTPRAYDPEDYTPRPRRTHEPRYPPLSPGEALVQDVARKTRIHPEILAPIADICNDRLGYNRTAPHSNLYSA